jgi:hypothetical protein
VGLSWLIPSPWLRDGVCVAGLGVTLWSCATTLHPGSSGARLMVTAALVTGGLAWVAASEGWPGARRRWLLPATLVIMGASGGVATTAGSRGLIFVSIAAAGAGRRRPR